MTQVRESLEDRLASARRQIEERLAAYLRPCAGCPEPLREAMRYSLLAGGKRLRPLLVLLACEACGGEPDSALPAACAVEMVHTYSLVHDDLPAMDDDDLRRGQPTSHKVYGEGMAILVGDALLTLAFEAIARDTEPADVAARCVRELAFAAGRCGMVGGQVDDLASARTNGDLAQLESLHERKTGALLQVCLRLGALVAGADERTFELLDEYGACLGHAFQITDDLLDVQGSEGVVGKRIQKDAAGGKLTYPTVLGVEESRRRARRLCRKACECIAPLGERAGHLDALAQVILERDR